ncbi:MAG: LysR family transcriptional regulator [Alphaproteobacteria bacterium]|nr:LysR family transcriptional regulator [Alphaproteobacteria bacterium]
MDESWDDLRLFLAAAQAGSFTAAARRLGLGQATLSRRIAALEERCGHVLFDRSRDGLHLTPAAEALLPHAEAMSEAGRLGVAALSGLEPGPAGVVRLAVPPGTAVDLIPPLLPLLRRRYPDLRLEVLSDNTARDLSRHEADVAIRSLRPTSGDLVFRRLGESALSVWASPDYVAALPKGATEADLDWVQWSSDLAHIPMATWVEARLAGRAPAFTSNSFLAMRAAAQHGAGAMVLPGLQGRLAGLVPVPVCLPPLPVLPFYVVSHRALRHVPRVAAVVDFIEEAMRDGEPDVWPPPHL